MKKTWLITVMLVVALALGVTLTACDQQPEPLPTYTVTVAQVTNGSVTITGVDGETHENYEQNSAVTVNVAPAQGYEVANVTVDGKSVSLTEGKYTFAIKANAQVAATFQSIVVVPTYTVTVGELANGAVTVTDVHGQAQASYEEGSVVVVNVAPAAHYQVASVTVGGKAVNLTEGQYGFVIGANTQVAAMFSAIQHEVVANYNANQGSVVIADAQGNEASVYDEAAVAKISVVPAKTYAVASVKVNGEAVELTEGAYSLTVNADAQVEVTFQLDDDYQALHDALAEIAESEYYVEKNNGQFAANNLTTYAFVISNDYMINLTTDSSGNLNVSSNGGYIQYEGAARRVTSYINSYSTSITLEDADATYHKSISDLRVDYNLDDYMQYLTLTEGKYVLTDNTLNKKITAGVLSHLFENFDYCSNKYYVSSNLTNYEVYKNIAICLDDEGHLDKIEIEYTNAAGTQTYNGSYTYTIGSFTDETQITYKSYADDKTITYGAIKNRIAELPVTLKSTIADHVGTYTNAEEKDIVISNSGITVDGVEMVITKLPTWNSSKNFGSVVEGTLNGKLCRLTYVSAKRVSLIVDGETEATPYAIGGIKEVVKDINAIIGTYYAKVSQGYWSDTYTVVITDAETASFEHKTDTTVQPASGTATKVEYNATTDKLVLTINGAEVVFDVVWGDDGVTALQYDGKTLQLQA